MRSISNIVLIITFLSTYAIVLATNQTKSGKCLFFCKMFQAFKTNFKKVFSNLLQKRHLENLIDSFYQILIRTPIFWLSKLVQFRLLKRFIVKWVMANISDFLRRTQIFEKKFKSIGRFRPKFCSLLKNHELTNNDLTEFCLKFFL